MAPGIEVLAILLVLAVIQINKIVQHYTFLVAAVAIVTSKLAIMLLGIALGLVQHTPPP